MIERNKKYARINNKPDYVRIELETLEPHLVLSNRAVNVRKTFRQSTKPTILWFFIL